jgi:uncharacterized membrane protein YoaK (UPF0700 family)
MDARGPLLPALLLALTAVTGLVDAYSYLRLGHVFVANMTGNVVFVAFGLAGAPGFSVAASLVALGAFFAGAVATGRAVARLRARRYRLLGVCCLGEAAAVGVAIAVSVTTHLDPGGRYAIIVLLAVALGAQNTMARGLAVPDLTTTVLTLTITGLGSDRPHRGPSGRRLASLSAMFAGALVGSVSTLKGAVETPLGIALGILLVATAAALGAHRSSGGVERRA